MGRHLDGAALDGLGHSLLPGRIGFAGKAIAQLLASYGLLDRLTKKKQERMLRAIYEILETAED